MADIANVLMALGAILGLLGAHSWYLVSASAGRAERGVEADQRHLRVAALFTAGFLALVSAGYLIGRIEGAFGTHPSVQERPAHERVG